MIIRRMQPGDLSQLQEIHQRNYEGDFKFPDYDKDDNYLPLFVVEDEKHRIISAGGLKRIVEAILITDKNFSPRERREALLLLLEAALYAAKAENHDQIHAFVQDENWEKQLEKYGFSRCKGNVLYLPIG